MQSLRAFYAGPADPAAPVAATTGPAHSGTAWGQVGIVVHSQVGPANKSVPSQVGTAVRGRKVGGGHVRLNLVINLGVIVLAVEALSVASV